MSKFKVGDIVALKCSPFDYNHYEHEMVGALCEVVRVDHNFSFYGKYEGTTCVVEVWEYEYNHTTVKYFMQEEYLEYVGSLD
jgi:hypothetical protein